MAGFAYLNKYMTALYRFEMEWYGRFAFSGKKDLYPREGRKTVSFIKGCFSSIRMLPLKPIEAIYLEYYRHLKRSKAYEIAIYVHYLTGYNNKLDIVNLFQHKKTNLFYVSLIQALSLLAIKNCGRYKLKKKYINL